MYIFRGNVFMINSLHILSFSFHIATTTNLQFAPFASVIDGGFWHKFSQLKLEVFHLDDSSKNIYGTYSNGKILV